MNNQAWMIKVMVMEIIVRAKSLWFLNFWFKRFQGGKQNSLPNMFIKLREIKPSI
jgi:hypothetical protein